MTVGRVVRVNGPLVEVEGLETIAMHDQVEIGEAGLPGEAVAVRRDRVTVQAYEYTGGLGPGEPVVGLGVPLSARLGPGLLGGTFDGLLRRLDTAPARLAPGSRSEAPPASWEFTPSAPVGRRLEPGGELGTVKEAGIVHRILVPPDTGGTVAWIAPEGRLGASDRVARVGEVEVRTVNPWPVRRPRPFLERLPAAAPLTTGQRVIDLLFPVCRGGSAAVPGGFGTGKTILLQQLAKWCHADVIVYVGCGERGNELADVMDEFSRIDDPRTGGRLSERTVVIANTSNMPVMAREASIHTGMTVGEYFRDMGYHAVVIADSTSRWAEALREFSTRAGELPAEEGYPANLASSLAAFYERSGRVLGLGGREGSVSVIGAVSPPGGDMTEPVTANTERFVRCLWALDRDLAYSRHYPAVSWRQSFSRDAESVGRWQLDEGDRQWIPRRSRVMSILSEADRLAAVAELVGVTALPARERMVLLTSRLLREAVLQQSAISANDSFCGPAKLAALADVVLEVHDKCLDLVRGGVPASALESVDFSPLIRAREEAGPDDASAVRSGSYPVFVEMEKLA